MTLELVDLLCEIIRIQTDIIERQNIAIEQERISEAAAAELLKLQGRADIMKKRIGIGGENEN